MSDIERYVGVVKWFNNKVGYGFITCLEKEYQNRDIFVHHSALVGEQQFKYLIQGEYVEFVLKHDPLNSKHPFSAQHVNGIKQGKLLFLQQKSTFNPQNEKSYKNSTSYKTPTYYKNPISVKVP